MKNNKLLSIGILIVIIVGIIGYASTAHSTSQSISNSSDKTKEINWLTYSEAVKLNKKKKKKIFIDVYTDWCGWCKKMDATTMKDSRVVEYMNKEFYAVKLNAESMDLVNYKGNSIVSREFAGRVLGVQGYPTTVYLDEDENVLTAVSSFLDPKVLDQILHFYGQNKYKNQTWDQFISTYVPE